MGYEQEGRAQAHEQHCERGDVAPVEPQDEPNDPASQRDEDESNDERQQVEQDAHDLLSE